MPGPAAEVLAVAVLLVVLGWAVRPPRSLPEALVAVPAAGLLLATGVVSAGAARSQVHELAGTVGFLVAVFVLAAACESEGLFAALGTVMAARCHGSGPGLLRWVFVIASAVTAVLSLDATVVLLTPVVLLTAQRIRRPARPHLYACGHLSNTASLLLPVSNLTNLLALRAAGVSFPAFAALMATPWLVAIGVEYAVLRRAFAGDLRDETRQDSPGDDAGPVDTPVAMPRFALGVLTATLIGFGCSSLAGVAPAWIAAAAATVLGTRALLRRRITPAAVLRAADLSFASFVLALGIIVAGVRAHGLGDAVDALLPHRSTLAGLLLAAVVAAVLANLVNNLPAVLMLLPVVTGHPALVLAVLIGVNVGPNLTYTGSLATLLWRRVLRTREVAVPLGEFLRIGALSTPPALLAATAALWASWALA